MVKEARIFFMSGEGGRIVKDGVTTNEVGDFNFRFRPVNSVRVKEVNGIPQVLVMHVDRSQSPKAPVEGCYFVFSDTTGGKIRAQEFIDVFIKQLETANARAALAEGQATRLGSELKKFKTQTQREIEKDADFHKDLQRKTRPHRPDILDSLGQRKIRTVSSPDEYEEYAEEGEE